jgi:hypothetical protein
VLLVALAIPGIESLSSCTKVLLIALEVLIILLVNTQILLNTLLGTQP